MKQHLSIIFLALRCISLAQGQTLASALSSYPEAQTFTQLITANPGIVNDFTTISPFGVTVLVPNNNAFDAYAKAHNGSSFTSIGADNMTPILRYHAMASKLTSSNFSQPGGITVPTLLKDEQYNNRSAGAALTALYGSNADGQVLYVASSGIGQTKFRVRQLSQAQLRAGLGAIVNLTAVDGQWDGGRFQIIDSILDPPQPCSATIRSIPSLGSLDNALNRTDLWSALDHSQNVTCLAPSTAAFNAAGKPDATLPVNELQKALLFHTLPMPLYSNFLQDGLKVNSLANETVQISIKGNDIFFNNAKVIAQNVLTNNGLVHILDRVMAPLNASETSGTPTASGPKPTNSNSAAVSSRQYGTQSQLSALMALVLAAFLT